MAAQVAAVSKDADPQSGGFPVGKPREPPIGNFLTPKRARDDAAGDPNAVRNLAVLPLFAPDRDDLSCDQTTGTDNTHIRSGPRQYQVTWEGAANPDGGIELVLHGIGCVLDGDQVRVPLYNHAASPWPLAAQRRYEVVRLVVDGVTKVVDSAQLCEPLTARPAGAISRVDESPKTLRQQLALLREIEGTVPIRPLMANLNTYLPVSFINLTVGQQAILRRQDGKTDDYLSEFPQI